MTIIQCDAMYDMISKETDLGSHCLFAYENVSGQIEVVVSLFGLMLYRVIVTESKPDFCNNNFAFIELRTDSSRKEVSHCSRAEAEKQYLSMFDPSNFTCVGNMNGQKIMMPIDTSKTSKVSLYGFLLNISKCFVEIHDDTTIVTEKTNKILRKQLDTIFKTPLIHKKTLKRFVNDYFPKGHTKIQINPHTSNIRTTLLFYVVYCIGKKDIQDISNKSIHDIMNNRFGTQPGATFHLNKEIEEQLISEMLQDDEYSIILDKGAEIISSMDS